MLIKEYRIVLPISVEEYQVGQLYAVAEASKNETGGGDGVTVLVNEERVNEETGEKCQYTHKVYHLASKVPKFISVLAPKNALELHEEAWNAYPYCKTILTNEFLKGKFQITIITWHKPDMGQEYNVHELNEDKLGKREIVPIDIASRDEIPDKDYQEEEDPAKFKSVKTGRGPLEEDWQKKLAEDPNCPHMCAYKLVEAEVNYIGSGKLENFIHKFEKRVFTKFHRQLFCWIDKWIELSMADIRELENNTKDELEKMIKTDQIRGSSAE